MIPSDMKLRSGASNLRLSVNPLLPKTTGPVRSKKLAGDRPMKAKIVKAEAAEDDQILSTPKSEPMDTSALDSSAMIKAADPSTSAIHVVVKEEIDDDQRNRIGIDRESHEEAGSSFVSNAIRKEEVLDAEDGQEGNDGADSGLPQPTEQPTDQNNIHEYCRRLILANHAPAEQFACGICGTMLNLWSKWESFIQTTALTHALSHTSIPAFRCRRCKFASNAPNELIDHATKRHKILNPCADDYTDRTQTYYVEVMQTLNECYGHTSNSGNGNSETQQAQSAPPQPSKLAFTAATKPMMHKYSANTLCIQLANKCTDRGHMQCLLCNIAINITNRRRHVYDTKVAIDHALLHLGKDMLECTTCHYRSTIRHAMGKHLVDAHGFACMDNRFEEKFEEYQEEICGMLTRCFDPQHAEKTADKVVGGGRWDIGVYKLAFEENPSSPIGSPKCNDKLSPMISIVRKDGTLVYKKRLAVVKFRNVSQEVHVCKKCQFTTQHKRLFIGHGRNCGV